MTAQRGFEASRWRRCYYSVASTLARHSGPHYGVQARREVAARAGAGDSGLVIAVRMANVWSRLPSPRESRDIEVQVNGQSVSGFVRRNLPIFLAVEPGPVVVVAVRAGPLPVPSVEFVLAPDALLLVEVRPALRRGQLPSIEVLDGYRSVTASSREHAR